MQISRLRASNVSNRYDFKAGYGRCIYYYLAYFVYTVSGTGDFCLHLFYLSNVQQFLSTVRGYYKLFDKALVETLACAALAMNLQIKRSVMF
jgi:hypothetical protein